MFREAVDAVNLDPLCKDQRECCEGRKLMLPIHIFESWWFRCGVHSFLPADQERENDMETQKEDGDAVTGSATFWACMSSLGPYGDRGLDKNARAVQCAM